MADDTAPIAPRLDDPLSEAAPTPERPLTPYETTLAEARALAERPYTSMGAEAIIRQHAKHRMTVWERMKVLSPEPPSVIFQNWGPNLDGASLVTAVQRIHGRDVAVYGHDFTQRAGSMDATNGRKLARLFELAGERGLPLIGMNDSAGAYVPAGVGGLDGYAEAFTALRRISGVVPSIMCMFGYNAGGGSYLPRQGSFMIQPEGTFFGLTGPAVIKSVLGEDVTPDDLGGPKVHGASGVVDLTVRDEVAALRTATRLLRYLPSNNRELAPHQPTSDPMDRPTSEVDSLLRRAFDSPTGFNTPIDVGIVIGQICDHGDYFEVQPGRARNAITAFGRLGGHVVGFVANNSAVASGQIDVAAAFKIARFVRFCNLYNVPVIFMEDTTGFLPGREQETMGIVHAGRAMLDAIIDLRTPRILLILRNAFGGAYASFNNYPTGADVVFALPTTRLAVMGPAGKEFVYKDELRAARTQAKTMGAEGAAWLKAREAELSARYERELMNPREALSLGSISRLVMPADLRRELGASMAFLLRHYTPSPMGGVQREFH
ncbi:MAG: carboxyl transferase domain-containing protein [Polyangiales bacterium]